MRGRQCALLTVPFLVLPLVTPGRVAGEVIARNPLPKLASISNPAPAQRQLTAKFRDDLKVREIGGNVTSIVGADLSNVEAIQAQHQLTFTQMIQLDQNKLDLIESAAAERSGMAQPDLAGMMWVSGPQEELEPAAQALLDLAETEWVYFGAIPPQPPCIDIAPPTTSNYFALGLQDYHDPDPGLDMTCAWLYGARGQGVQIADCEIGYHRGHEDLCNINEPVENGTIIAQPHGTTVLGEMVALDNSYGCTGLVPDAEAWFFSERQNGTSLSVANRVTAIANATWQLLEDGISGDVVLLEMQTFGIFGVGLSRNAPAEIEPYVWILTKLATDAGLVVVAAAGNGDRNLDCPDCPECPGMICPDCPGDDCLDFSYYQAFGDSGAIIVGAGTSNTNHDRCTKTNMCAGQINWGSCYGERVNVQGWGENVFTLGWIGIGGVNNIE